MERSAQKTTEEKQLNSAATFNASFNLTGLPVSDVSTVSDHYETVYPSFQIGDSDVLEFNLPVSSTHYTNLSKSFLYLRVKIVDKDGSDIADNSKTAPVNLLFSSLFRNLEIYLNNVLINSIDNNYGYSSYIHRMLTSTKVDKETKLQSELYYPSSSANSLVETNTMYKNLINAAQTKNIELYSVINHSLFEQKRQLIPGMSIRLRFRLNSPQFYLMTSKPSTVTTAASGGTSGGAATPSTTVTTPFTEKIAVLESYIDLHRSIANSRIQSHHESLLSRGSKIYYLFKDRNCLSYNVMAGSITHVSETLLSKTPTFACIALVDTKGYNGSENIDPFGFYHNNLISASMLINGEKSMFANPKFSVPDKQYMRLYRQLFTILNKNGETMNLSLADFTTNGMFILPLWWNDDSLKTDRTSVPLDCNVKVALTFKEATSKNLTVLYYYCYDRLLSFDKNHVYLE